MGGLLDLIWERSEVSLECSDAVLASSNPELYESWDICEEYENGDPERLLVDEGDNVLAKLMKS